MRPKFFNDMIVSLDTPEQISLWTKELSATLPQLRLAIVNAGNRFNDVREELGMARIYIFPRDDRVMQRLVANGLLPRH